MKKLFLLGVAVSAILFTNAYAVDLSGYPLEEVTERALVVMEGYTQEQVDEVYGKIFDKVVAISNKRYDPNNTFNPEEQMAGTFLKELMMNLYKDGRLPSTAKWYTNNSLGYKLLVPTFSDQSDGITAIDMINGNVEEGSLDTRHIRVVDVSDPSQLQAALDKAYSPVIDREGNKLRCIFDKLVDAQETYYDKYDKAILLKEECQISTTRLRYYSPKYKKAAFRTIGQAINFSAPGINDEIMINSFQFIN